MALQVATLYILNSIIQLGVFKTNLITSCAVKSDLNQLRKTID